MARPLVVPFPIPSANLRRRWRRARRSRLGWWLCAVVVGVTATVQLRAATAEVQRARAAWGATVAVAVASRDLPAGHRLAAGDLHAEHWPTALVPDGASTTVEHLAGRALRAEVVAGEAVLEVRLAAEGSSTLAGRLPPGHEAVGIDARTAPPLEVGDRVDVVDTSGVGTVVAEGAVVVDVADDGTVTVAIPEDRAPTVARAGALAPLALTLLAG